MFCIIVVVAVITVVVVIVVGVAADEKSGVAVRVDSVNLFLT